MQFSRYNGERSDARQFTRAISGGTKAIRNHIEVAFTDAANVELRMYGLFAKVSCVLMINRKYTQNP